MTDDADTDADPQSDRDAATATCESCGRADEVVAPVHRVYLTPTAGLDGPDGSRVGSRAGSGTGESREEPEARVEEAVERWCASCRENYPHVPA